MSSIGLRAREVATPPVEASAVSPFGSLSHASETAQRVWIVLRIQLLRRPHFNKPSQNSPSNLFQPIIYFDFSFRSQYLLPLLLTLHCEFAH